MKYYKKTSKQINYDSNPLKPPKNPITPLQTPYTLKHREDRKTFRGGFQLSAPSLLCDLTPPLSNKTYMISAHSSTSYGISSGNSWLYSPDLAQIVVIRWHRNHQCINTPPTRTIDYYSYSFHSLYSSS